MNSIISKEELEDISELAFTALRGFTRLGGQVKIENTHKVAARTEDKIRNSKKTHLLEYYSGRILKQRRWQRNFVGVFPDCEYTQTRRVGILEVDSNLKEESQRQKLDTSNTKNTTSTNNPELEFLSPKIPTP